MEDEEYEKAIKYYQKASEINPNEEYPKSQIKKINELVPN